ncbi:MAG TPA: IclR family transcriptional regulator [Anaerolineales bacterium]
MTNRKNSERNARYHIRALDRALRLLSLLSDGKPRTSTEISEGIRLSPSTTFRILVTLASHNFVARDENNGQYRLGLACLQLARGYQDTNDIRRMALPLLESLRDDIKETVHLAILDNMEVAYLEKLSGLHAIGIMSSRVGGRAPAYCTGVGKILLAYQDQQMVEEHFTTYGLNRYTETTITDLLDLMGELDATRQRGYSFDNGEHEHEVRCIAAPIFDLNGKAVAAVSVSGPYARLDPLEENHEMIEKVIRTALEISFQLGYLPAENNRDQREDLSPDK